MTTDRFDPRQVPTFESRQPPILLVSLSDADDTCVIRFMGELDCCTRDQFVSVASVCHHPSIVIDLSGITFMDCSGYGALVASRVVIEGEGRSVTVTGQTGQPARLLDLIAELESVHRDGAGLVSVGWSS